MMKIISQSSGLIRFSDCDPFHHLNHSKYLEYFIRAREDHLKADHDLDIYRYAAATGCSWVIRLHQLAYLQPAFLGETVVIESTLIDWKEKEIGVEMRMWNEKKDKLKALLWSVFVHVDLTTQKSKVHPEDLTSQFRPLVNPSINMDSFEARVNFIKNKSLAELQS